MKALAVIAAGATFAFCALAGLTAGIVLSERTGEALWVLGGVMAGLAAGGYGAYRLLLRAL